MLDITKNRSDLSDQTLVLNPDTQFGTWQEIPAAECSGDFSKDSPLMRRLSGIEARTFGCEPPQADAVELWFRFSSTSLEIVKVRRRHVGTEGLARLCDYEITTIDETKVIAAFRITWV